MPYSVKTIYECQKFCSTFSYFAIQMSTACMCGNRYSTAPQYGKREPQTRCFNHETGMSLGGDWSNAVSFYIK